MKQLGIDIETYSSADLMKSGVYRYTEAPDFAILLFAYSIDNGPVKVIDLTPDDFGDAPELPELLRNALVDPKVLKTAWNASFERTCIAKHFNLTLDPVQWECTMVKASMLGLPLSLDAAGKAMKLDVEKDAAGKALIKYFSVPCKPSKKNGERTRNLPHHDLEKWGSFINYCRRDVEVEQEIRKKISFFEIPETEKKLYALDQRINDRGVLLDPGFVKNAIKINREYLDRLEVEAVELTKLDNPNSAAQLKTWLSNELGEEVEKLRKGDIDDLKKKAEDVFESEAVKRVLEIRQEMAKTSVTKYIAMANSFCKDNRVRGLLQFYGANRTGRWAGRLVQVQNLPQNKLKDLGLARKLVKKGDLEMLELCFGNIPDTLSQLIRTSFIPPKGKRFIVSDFSAIEARVIAWLAGEQWRLEVFKNGGDIYVASASRMFKIPIEQVDKSIRQKGKVAELALGYQGGVNALTSMDYDKKLTEDEKPEIVSSWRLASKKIVQLWYDVQDACWKAIEEGVPQFIQHGVGFFVEKNILFIELPSKRRLAYRNPRIGKNRFGNTGIVYEGMDQTTKKWGTEETYGGKLVENIVQAIARDCLAHAMLKLDEKGFEIIMHVHDEVVAEMEGFGDCVGGMNGIMAEEIPWAKGLPLGAAGFETEYYKKD